MEEQIKKLQEELELVKKERDNLILEKNKTIIKSRIKTAEIADYRSAMFQTYETKLTQELLNEYGSDLIVECMIELLKEKENE